VGGDGYEISNNCFFLGFFNGDRLDTFIPSRGIRQGDPISPYLFLLAAEGLSCLLNSRIESSNLSGIKVAASAPMVSHLLFADDSLLFFRANTGSAGIVKEALDVYCQASGQRINSDKSSIHFAKGVRGSVREEIMDTLEVHNMVLSEKYLGMPTDVGVSTNGAFKYLKDSIWKIQGWMEQTLSVGGKEVLIKAVAQVVPTFSMSCFRLLRGLCQHIDSLLRGFQWGSKEGKRRTCWVAWEDMTKPKYMGGLGFRDIKLLNLDLLARQAWRILQDPETLSARVLKAVYFPETDFLLSAELGASPSRIWRAVIDVREVLNQGIIRRIGTGDETDIWHTNWIPRDGILRSVSCMSNAPPTKVCDLIDPVQLTWDLEQLKQHFLPMDWEVIEKIPLPLNRQPDFWAWHYEKSGVFSVRSAYRMLVHTRERRTAWIEHKAGSSAWKQIRKNGRHYGKSRSHPSCEFFYGDLRDSRSRRGMFDTTDTWLNTAIAQSVGNQILGDAPCLNVTWRGVCGFCKGRKS
jgi:hypothetical protein